MDPLIYTIMSGASRTMHAIQVHANNMANAQTDGFRAELETSQSQPVPGFGYDARHMVRVQANSVSANNGVVQETGRDLDAAILGEGYFAVQTGDGEAYTRAGNFSIDAEGTLTLGGRAVMGDGGPIVVPENSTVSIGNDGTISAVVPGEPEAQIVDRLAVVSGPAADLVKSPEGLLVTRDGAPLPAVEERQVLGGHLERSNVSPVEEMLASMSLHRDYEIQMRMYSAANEMADAGNRLIRG
ncbi:flagellar basal body rod protein FlgF [Pandoraea pulmonicola]|uniref:Flagellar basal-body rod protein FlgF n=1 Tax=Pandoraea pulmonicola TaxID=93221 RepID=A0AAJ4ZB54_PANPU|nr:flagellar basal body rod protein FlgF [Pandoraea pulmonicola]AJC21228.1 flagellar biosynthesis protein FlgF [Pandoraea pulmonicola]SUA90086.1 Putative proximal rod protein [Pandoraea pulmonicola]